MTIKLVILALIAAAAVLSAAVPAEAAWIEDGVQISTGPNSQRFPRMVPNGAGGMIITWENYVDGDMDIYAQNLDGFGNALWTEGGVVVCSEYNQQYEVRIAQDGEGGAIIAWTDVRNGSGTEDIYAQRVDADGNTLWTAGGISVSAYTGVQNDPCIISDGAGGAIVTWVDLRGGERDIYAQKIDADGNRVWEYNGVAVCTWSAHQYDPELCSDGAGGAIVTWKDYRDALSVIYAQRVTSGGTAAWTADGVRLCSETFSQRDPKIVPDGTGGAIATWYMLVSDYDIYAQRIDSGGTVSWAPGGVAVCSAPSNQMMPEIIPDGSGGAIIAWNDYRFGADCDIYGQRISYYGLVAWAADGVEICGAQGIQTEPVIDSDGAGGAVIAWWDTRFGAYDIYAQKVDGSGTSAWPAGGVKVSDAYGQQDFAWVLSDGSGGAFIAWNDERGGDDDIYAQRIERNGYWGYPSPVIAGAGDVPGDQGGYVNLAWDASRLDPWPEEIIANYTVWRAIDPVGAPLMIDDGATVLHDASEYRADLEGDVLRVEHTAAGSFYWKLINTIDAYHLESYSEVVPTLFDSTGTSDGYHFFQVIAHADDPSLYWISSPDSARSVDNLAPEAPLSLSGEQLYAPGGLQLTWDPNVEADLAGYNIYRGTDGSFEPGPGNFLAATPDTASFDGGWSWEAGYWYKVAAVDIHGNESGFALLSPDMLTGDEPMPLPGADFLAQNWPNPFNPATTIEFGLKESGHVSLRIYDAAGRLVRVLIDEDRPAGSYKAVWNGSDSAGAKVSSGVYFYRLSAGEFIRTRKMVLLR
jgi:hypothetical protein